MQATEPKIQPHVGTLKAQSIVEVRHLNYNYTIAGQSVPVLKNVSFTVRAGDFVCIHGSSGSGKSTLFYILGCLLKPTSGKVSIGGADLTSTPNEKLASLRNKKIGFIFQQFHLVPKMTILENILLPVRYSEAGNLEHAAVKAQKLATQLNISHLLHKFPNQLSGGQQQRAAIIRALMNNVDLILADEPTGALDSKNAEETVRLLRSLNGMGKTIILITHDPKIAKSCPRSFSLVEGELNEDLNLDLINFKHTHLIQEPSENATPALEKRWALLKTFRTVARLGTENLKRNKMRSFLTMLGVSVGISSVLAMVTFGNYAKRKTVASFETLGVNKLTVGAFPNHRLKATDYVIKPFESFDWNTDVLPMKSIFPEIAAISPDLVSYSVAIEKDGKEFKGQSNLRGTAPAFKDISNLQIDKGKFFDDFHVANSSPVCVLGSSLALKLVNASSLIGESVFVRESDDTTYPCRIIGILKPTGSPDANVDFSVYVPYTYLRLARGVKKTQIRRIVLQAKPSTEMETLAKKIRGFLRNHFGMAADVYVISDTILLAQLKKFLSLFGLMLISIAALSLLVGGIGINNMMLVSVNERLKEIGLMKALGASDKSIRLQFLFESITLCGVAGIIGVIFGIAAYEVIILGASQYDPRLTFEWVFDTTALLISLLAILLVGIASGVTPALRAEKLEVIEALRSE